jgi:Flp pilus assembly protein TadD
MNYPPRYAASACLILICAVGGCATDRSSAAASKTYRTAAKGPGHDAERAKRLNAHALELMKQGKSDLAEKALKDALAADVSFGPAHNNLGKLYFDRGEFYLAAWEFQYASKVLPEQPEPHNNLGLVYEAAGKLDEALQAYHKALQLAPDDPQFIGNAARVRVRRGDRDAKLRDLLQRLITHDTRAHWVEWARETLTLLESQPPVERNVPAPAPEKPD